MYNNSENISLYGRKMEAYNKMVDLLDEAGIDINYLHDLIICKYSSNKLFFEEPKNNFEKQSKQIQPTRHALIEQFLSH